MARVGKVYNTAPRTLEQAMSELRRDGASFVPTSDDWYPNWPGETVKVMVYAESDGTGRVSVWGADDCGMERRFEDAEAARRCRQELPVVISKAALRDLRFVGA